MPTNYVAELPTLPPPSPPPPASTAYPPGVGTGNEDLSAVNTNPASLSTILF